jgi:DNA-binding transcriptional ArsR family regulator
MAVRGKFESKITSIADGLKSLGHPGRILILQHLMSHGECSCQDIVDQLPYSQSTVSGHLQKLKDGKLIKMKSIRTSSVYTIDMEAIEQLHKDFGDLFNLTNEKKQLSLF